MIYLFKINIYYIILTNKFGPKCLYCCSQAIWKAMELNSYGIKFIQKIEFNS